MHITRSTIAALAITLASPGFADAATFFSGNLTRVAADLYEGTRGELINTSGCTRPATAAPSLVRIDTSTGPVIGGITFPGGALCDIAAVYAPYANVPAGTYGTVLGSLDAGFYVDTTVAPFWIVRGAPTCPAASGTPAYLVLPETGPSYVPPGDPLGTITLDPTTSPQSCPLIGIFGQVDLMTLPTATLSVSKDGAGTGTVASDPAVIDCGATCTAEFGTGTMLTLVATPAAGSTFAGWNGACTGAGSCTVTLESAAQVTATFLPEAPLSFSLSVYRRGTGSGGVTSAPTGIDCGAACSGTFAANVPITLTAAAGAGSTFTGWSGEGCAGTGTCTVPMNAAAHVTAMFTLDTPLAFALTLSRAGNGAGSVTSTPAGIDCGATCTFAFDLGTSVTLAAQAAAGSLFAGWSGAGCAGTGPCTVTMSAARAVTATFAIAAPTAFTLTVTRNGTGTGTVTSGTGEIACGATCQAELASRTVVSLQAVADAGSVFAGWSGGGCSGTGACVVVMDAAEAVTATFTRITFALTVTKSGAGAGTVVSTPAGIACGAACSATFGSGASVALAATASAGSFFTGWTGACSGTGACNVTMDAAKSVGAEFKLNTGIPRLANISTRMQVLTGNDVLIGGFIIGGNAPKTVVVRARGPSLIPFGITNALANPTMQLFSGQTVLSTNDDWGTAANAAALTTSGFAPSSPLESAILTTLSPGAYTAVVSGVGGTTGVGIIEVFEVDRPDVPLANISTRGQVLTGGDVMIGGFVIQGDSPQTVVVRARGPSLVPHGITNALMDPVLQLYTGATPIATNDDWQVQTAPADVAAIQGSGFAPADTRESVIRITLSPGAYTAIVTGRNGATGVGIIEVFAQ